MSAQRKSFAQHAIAAVAVLILLSGCATAQRPDPLEAMNRRVFVVNKVMDDAVVTPVAKAYRRTLPAAVRTGVSNFFDNPKDLWSALNLTLQGRPLDGLSDVGRFGINTTVGLLGVIDVASSMGLRRHGEDLGQTLGRWGIGSGAYLVLPLLGPSTLRDVTNLPADLALTPQANLSNVPLRNSLTVLDSVSARASLLGTTDLLESAALDPYLFMREAYLQHRRNLVHDGDPPPVDPMTPPAQP